MDNEIYSLWLFHRALIEAPTCLWHYVFNLSQDKSARNKKNRSELKTNHISGSRSFLNHCRHSEVTILYYYIILIIMFRAYVNYMPIMCRWERMKRSSV
jgi:hypothetical protein